MSEDNPHPKDPTYDHFTEIACAVPGAKKVLDVPTGLGPIARRLKDKGYDVTPADISPSNFTCADMKCDTANLNGRLPYEDGTFDLVVCREGIEHVENQFHTVREFHRILKPGGWFLFSTPNLLTLRSRMSFLLVGGRHFKDRPAREDYDMDAGDHINLRTYLDLRMVLRRVGFRIDRVTTFSYSFTSLVLFWMIPIIAFYSWKAFRREKHPEQRIANKEAWRHVFSADMLFGKKLIVLSQREVKKT